MLNGLVICVMRAARNLQGIPCSTYELLNLQMVLCHYIGVCVVDWTHVCNN